MIWFAWVNDRKRQTTKSVPILFSSSKNYCAKKCEKFRWNSLLCIKFVFTDWKTTKRQVKVPVRLERGQSQVNKDEKLVTIESGSARICYGKYSWHISVYFWRRNYWQYTHKVCRCTHEDDNESLSKQGTRGPDIFNSRRLKCGH